MPTTSVDPGVDEGWEHEEVECATHEHAGEEGHHELEPVHRAVAGELTARTYPVGGPGSRPGSDQRAVMPSRSRRRAPVSSWPIGPSRLRVAVAIATAAEASEMGVRRAWRSAAGPQIPRRKGHSRCGGRVRSR